MKNNKMILALFAGLLAAIVAAVVISFRASVNADTLIGYGSVLALLGIAALEYRMSLKRVLGR